MVSGFTIAMPEGWQQVLVDDEGKKQLTAQLSARFKTLGRLDLDVEGRMLIAEQWRKLQATKVSAIYLPGPNQNEIVLPMSIAVRQHQAPPGKTFESSIADFAGVALERFDTPIGVVQRWERTQRGSDELAEVRSTQIGHAFQLPGPEGERRGIVFIASITSVDETDPQALEVLKEGVGVIMETFRWK